MNKRILIAEPETPIADRLERSLGTLGYSVVGKVHSCDAAFTQAAMLHPDLLLMDVSLGEFGVEAAKRIFVQHDVPIVFFGDFKEHELHATIEFELYRHEKARRLREASRRLLDAAMSFAGENGSAAAAEVVPGPAPLNGFDRAEVAPPQPGHPKGLDMLSRREREVLDLFLRGFGTVTIGQRLHVAPQTVRNHLKNTCRKLDVRTQIQLRELFIDKKWPLG